MINSRFVAALVLSLSTALFAPPVRAQETSAQPQLQHFDPDLADKSLDPCNDFYKYSCSKWLTANPLPPDQVFWSTGSVLELWNENLLRETLEAAASASNRS